MPEARRFLLEHVTSRGVDPDTVETAVFLLSEVVTNAVLHARTAVTVRCTTDPGGVLVEVSDRSRLVPLPRHHDEEAVTGRGLELVELLAGAYGTAYCEAGKTVWFTVGTVATDLPRGWSPAPADAATVVHLRDVPVGLYDVLQQHNEAVLREYELLRLAEGADLSERRDIADAARARVLVATAIQEASAATPPPSARATVALPVPPEQARGFRLLPVVLDAAEAAAVRGLLLTRPALPELLELRAWLYGEISRQLAGREPVAWSSSESELSPPVAPEMDVDLSWLPTCPEAVVVADDGNRIMGVSPAAARLLGWSGPDLVGQRITAIIPARLREAHVTGFTRHVVTGRGRLFGTEPAVAGLHRDGHEVPLRLRLEHSAVGGRTVYTGWLLPPEQP